jgi:hypothetical protein
LSPSTGLPALAIPAGFTPRGLPVGIELLGPAFSEQRLLALAYGWEVAARPRQAPFSTPPLVAGKAPVAQTFTTRIAAGDGAAVVQWRYDPVTAHLAANVTITAQGQDTPVALALHRRHGDGPGAVLAPLVVAGQSHGTAELVLDGRDRADLAAGRLYVALYTRAAPLGAGQAALVPPRP